MNITKSPFGIKEVFVNERAGCARYFARTHAINYWKTKGNRGIASMASSPNEFLDASMSNLDIAREAVAGAEKIRGVQRTTRNRSTDLLPRNRP